MSIKTDLVELGVAGPLAEELQRQIASKVGNKRRLMELGFVAAPQFISQLAATPAKPNSMAEAGLPTVVAKYIVKKINPA